jgi:apolipoprotein N-acyltransferase
MTFTPWKDRGAAVVTGLLLAAAFPPLNWWPLALVALVPLLLAVWSRSARLGKPFQALVYGINHTPELNAAQSSSDAVTAADGQPSVDPCGQNFRPLYPGAISPECGDGVSGGVETQGLEGLATLPGKETHGPESRAPFWPAFRLGWLFGFVFFTATLWWIQHVTLPGMLALTAYLALYPAVLMGMAAWLGMPRDERWGPASGKVLLLAGSWAGLEWVRSVALSGFPWNGLAVPLFDLHLARSLSAFTGVIGLSGAVVLIPLGAAAFLRIKGRRAGPALFRWAACWVVLELVGRSGLGADSAAGGSFYRAVLVQPNVTMEEKMSPDPEVQRQRYFDLLAQTDEALAEATEAKPDLVVWPESAVPGFFDEMVQGGAFVDQLQQGDFSLVTGADHEEWGKLYNSVVAMRGTTENHALHPKVRLVPFGEFIPFRKQVPLFEKMLGGLIPMDFTRGTSLEPLKVSGQPFSLVPLVCFEDTMGDHARRFIRPEPQILVNVTNDNWFHQSPATEMHFANARWRAPELRRTLVRSANTGVTAIVSPQGGVKRIPSFQREVLAGWINAGTGEVTFYAKYGDVAAKLAGALSLLGCLAVFLRRKFSISAALITNRQPQEDKAE